MPVLGFAFAMPGPWEIAMIAGVALLLFGPTMLPRLARSMGSSIFEFKNSMKEAQNAFSELEEDPKAKKKA